MENSIAIKQKSPIIEILSDKFKNNQHYYMVISKLQKSPIIELELEWDGSSGCYSKNDYEIELDDYFLQFDLSVTKIIKVTSETHLNPQESTVISFDIDVSDLKVFKDEISISFENSLYKSIVKEVKSLIK